MSLILFGFYPTLHLHFCRFFIVLRGFPGPLLVHFSFSGFHFRHGCPSSPWVVSSPSGCSFWSVIEYTYSHTCSVFLFVVGGSVIYLAMVLGYWGFSDCVSSHSSWPPSYPCLGLLAYVESTRQSASISSLPPTRCTIFDPVQSRQGISDSCQQTEQGVRIDTVCWQEEKKH